jgi:hypothetical protein
MTSPSKNFGADPYGPWSDPLAESETWPTGFVRFVETSEGWKALPCTPAGEILDPPPERS